jgi:hypothetical protein
LKKKKKKLEKKGKQSISRVMSHFIADHDVTAATSTSSQFASSSVSNVSIPTIPTRTTRTTEDDKASFLPSQSSTTTPSAKIPFQIQPSTVPIQSSNAESKPTTSTITTDDNKATQQPSTKIPFQIQSSSVLIQPCNGESKSIDKDDDEAASESEEEEVPKPTINVTGKMRVQVRKAITAYLLKNHKHSVRYGNRPNDFYIYRPVPADTPDLLPHHSSLLIARAMPALIDYLNEHPTYLADCKSEILNFDAVLQESAYRAYRRRVNARSRPITHPTPTQPKINHNFGHIIHSKRKRKKTVNYAVVQSARFHEEERQRERERIARRKLERERLERERIAQRQARERERLERRRLRELERREKMEKRRGYAPRTAFDLDFPKSYGVISGKNVPPIFSGESVDSILLSVSHFVWSAAPVRTLRV